MPRCVDKIKRVLFTVFCLVNGSYRLRLDGDSPLPFKIHVVEHLLLHLTLCKKTGLLYNTVGER